MKAISNRTHTPWCHPSYGLGTGARRPAVAPLPVATELGTRDEEKKPLKICVKCVIKKIEKSANCCESVEMNKKNVPIVLIIVSVQSLTQPVGKWPAQSPRSVEADEHVQTKRKYVRVVAPFAS